MKFNKWLCSVFLAMVTTLAFAPSADAYTASYGSSAVPPSISVKNTWYEVTFPVLGSPPSNSIIYQIGYSWGYSSYPAGLEVQICDFTGVHCWNITNFQSGAYSNLEPKKIPGNRPFVLRARVVGSGSMMPIYGSTSRVSVNYEW